MDSNLYRDILAEFLLPFGSQYYDSNLVLHQDNDPKHKSMLCVDFLNRNHINWVTNLKINQDFCTFF